MNEAPRYASLSSGLLARKGTAKPAMRPQGFSGGFEDLGWNDMGHAPGEDPRAEPTPEHVPSSIAALTPAPKLTRTVPGEPVDEAAIFDGPEQGEEIEAIEAAEDIQPIEAIEETEDFHPIEATGEAEDIQPIEAIEAQQFEAPAQAEAEPTSDAPELNETFDARSVVAQQRAILERFEREAEIEAEAASAAPVTPHPAARAEVVPLPKRQAATDVRKAAFTLRLDSDRHLRLRLACAVSGHSAQQIVARALDEALASLPEIEALASQVPAKPGRAGGVKRN